MTSGGLQYIYGDGYTGSSKMFCPGSLHDKFVLRAIYPAYDGSLWCSSQGTQPHFRMTKHKMRKSRSAKFCKDAKND